MRNLLFLLVIAFVSFSHQAYSQERGDLNKRGYFEFTDYKTRLAYLDANRRDGILGDTYFYFTLLDKVGGSKKLVVINVNSDFAENKVTKFSSLKNGFSIKTDNELTHHVVNDSVYNKVRQLSEDEFFSRYVEDTTEFGILKNIKDWEIEKAVLLRLLKSGINVSLMDVSGDWVLTKHRIAR